METTTSKTYPQVFLASPLETLAGEWVPAVDATTEADRIRDEYGHEEVVIVDYEYMGDLTGRYPSIEKVERRAEAIEQAHDADAFRAYLKHADNMLEIEDVMEQFKRSYRGSFDDLEHFAHDDADALGYFDSMEEAGLSPCYFDVDAYKRDLEASGQVFMVGDYVFDQRGM